MKSEQENFEALRKLMALKRYELPPPRYMNQLSGKIISRIERGEGQLTFWDRLVSNFTLRPGLAYAFGLSVCSAVAVSSFYMVKQQAAGDSLELTLNPGFRGMTPVANFANQTSSAAVVPVANWLGYTNYASDQSAQALFGDVFQPASYSVGH